MNRPAKKFVSPHAKCAKNSVSHNKLPIPLYDVTIQPSFSPFPLWRSGSERSGSFDIIDAVACKADAD
jgi:hypothetical protein